MEGSKATNKPHRYESVNYQNNRRWSFYHCSPNCCVLASHDPPNIYPAECKHVYTKKGRGEDKHEEETVISLQAD